MAVPVNHESIPRSLWVFESSPQEFEFCALPPTPVTHSLEIYSKTLSIFYSQHADHTWAQVTSVFFMKMSKKPREQEYIIGDVVINGEAGFICVERIGGAQFDNGANRFHVASDYNPEVYGNFLAKVAYSPFGVVPGDVVSRSSKVRINSKDEELGRMIFTPEHPMLLYEFILLAHAAQKTCPYNTISTDNCYLYAGFLFKLIEKHSGATPIVSPSNEAKLEAWRSFLQTYETDQGMLEGAMTGFHEMWQVFKVRYPPFRNYSYSKNSWRKKDEVAAREPDEEGEGRATGMEVDEAIPC